MTNFKYFERPDKLTGFIDEETTCDICQKIKPCFDAETFYGADSISAICPECLAGGALYSKDIFTCEGDSKALGKQIKSLNPAMPDEAVEQLVRQKTAELEKTMPHLITWQDWRWPCADGDYCTFIGFGSKPLYNRLAKNLDGLECFKNSIYYTIKDGTDPDQLWADAIPDKEIPDYAASSVFLTLFYVFKSQHSNDIITIWDCV